MNSTDRKLLAGIRRERDLVHMREGRRQRATTEPDRRKAASKSACRKFNRKDW